MKFFAVLVTLTLSLSAFATSIQTQQQFQLNKVIENGKLTANVAILHIDHYKKTIEIKVYQDTCGYYSPNENPGKVRCMAMPILKFILNAPLQSVTSGCGSHYYSGTIDKRPVDGAMVNIKFANNSQRVCENVIESIYVVDAQYRGPRDNSTTQYKMLK